MNKNRAGFEFHRRIRADLALPNHRSIERRNFRLLSRLPTQVQRILKVNDFPAVTKDIVVAGRDSLVIGQVLGIPFTPNIVEDLRGIAIQATALA